MGFQKNLIAIHFSAIASTNYGESVSITGNCPELGMWDPAKGFKLQTNPKQYPIWYGKNPIVLQKLTPTEFKICILGSDGNVTRWQNLKQNRTMSLKTSCSVFLTQGQLEAEYEQELEDTTSTRINSTKKECLSEIEEESDDDQLNKENISLQVIGKDKKRPGSSNRSSHSHQIPQLKIHSESYIESKTEKRF